MMKKDEQENQISEKGNNHLIQTVIRLLDDCFNQAYL